MLSRQFSNRIRKHVIASAQRATADSSGRPYKNQDELATTKQSGWENNSE